MLIINIQCLYNKVIDLIWIYRHRVNKSVFIISNLVKKMLKVGISGEITWFRTMLKLLKVYAVSAIFAIPIILISLIFAGGKLPPGMINICILLGAALTLYLEFRRPSEMSLKPAKNQLFKIIICIIISLSYFAAVIILNLIFDNKYHLSGLIRKPESFLALLGIISYYFLVAFSEELFFRAYILNVIIKRKGAKVIALSVQAILFSAMHIVSPSYDSLPAFIFAFIIGLMLGYLALEQGNIWGVVVLHWANNVLSDIVVINESVQFMLPALLVMWVIAVLIHRKAKNQPILSKKTGFPV